MVLERKKRNGTDDDDAAVARGGLRPTYCLNIILYLSPPPFAAHLLLFHIQFLLRIIMVETSLHSLQFLQRKEQLEKSLAWRVDARVQQLTSHLKRILMSIKNVRHFFCGPSEHEAGFEKNEWMTDWLTDKILNPGTG